MGPTPLRIALVATAAVTLAACGAGSPASSSAGPSGAPERSAGGAATPGVAPAGGLSGAASAGESTAGPAIRASSSVGAAQIGTSVAAASPDVVETGTVDVRLPHAADVVTAFRAVTAMAPGADGFVASSSLLGGSRPSATLSLRVPNPELTGLTQRIAALGRVTARRQTGRDVTGQVVDLAVEIRNLDSEETAVRGLLGRARTVSSILTVQNQLFDLQGQIQELTAVSNSLDNRVEYATLAVGLSAVAPAPPPRHHRHQESVAAHFWRLARSHTIGSLRDALYAVGWAAPVLILAAVGAAGRLGWSRRRRRPVPTPAGPDAT
jgi:hypothetical protein